MQMHAVLATIVSIMDDTPPLTVPEEPKRAFFSRNMLSHPAFMQGIRDMFSLAPGFGAWGLVTGMAMVKAGMPVDLAIWMSVLVYAGSAQLAALPLMITGAPIWIVLLAGFCVNLRFVIFSLQWRPYFVRYAWWQRWLAGYLCGDLTYVLFMRRFPKTDWREDQMPYFWGNVGVNWAIWQGAALVGIVLGNMIPEGWGIQFAAVLAILAVTFTMLSGWITWFTMVVAALVVVFARDVFPFDLNIVVAIITAVVAALIAEKADYVRGARERLRVRQAADAKQKSEGREP
ncbi:MAG: hypothetical protein MESAZ_01590 [Saezia sanguinis]